MQNLLFVYGTLRSEFDNEFAQFLRTHATRLGIATVRGSIFLIGDYPGYKPDPAGVVRGELYQLAQPAAALATLDDYEGAHFERVPVSVDFDDANLQAWIYRFNGGTPAEARIESGDFCA